MSHPALPIGLLVLFLAAAAGEPTGQQAITVSADQDRGPVRLYTGWLHGFEEPDPYPVEKIHALNTSAWRISKWWMHDHVRQFTDNIQFELTFSWRWNGYGNPVANLTLWQQYVHAWVDYSLSEGKHVEYWDIWNEPDHAYFWSWSYDDLLLTYRTAVELIRERDPDARFVGPSFAKFEARDNFNGKTVADFVTDLYSQHGILLDAISWHMNDEWYPWNIQGHADTLRATIAGIGGGYDPELIINEYTQSLIVLRPVYLASFVWHMDRADIDYANLACWDLYDTCSPPVTFSSCWAGLNGLFTDDFSSEQHPYWFYLWHAREQGGLRLVVSEPEINTFAIASRNDAREEIAICVGKHDHVDPVEDVSVTVTGYPYGGEQVRVAITGLPAGHQVCFGSAWYPRQVPCPDGPIPVSSRLQPVNGGEIRIDLENFVDDDLYFIEISKPIFVDRPRRRR